MTVSNWLTIVSLALGVLGAIIGWLVTSAITMKVKIATLQAKQDAMHDNVLSRLETVDKNVSKIFDLLNKKADKS